MKEILLGDDKAAPLFPVALASRGLDLVSEGGLAQLTNQMTDSAISRSDPRAFSAVDGPRI